MHIVHQGQLNGIELTVARGDLFDAEVDAIVNSEQTDFILDRYSSSISGQIWRRYGASVQSELNHLTRGQKMGAGTVLCTSGGGDFKRIFHAGFHTPEDWPGEPNCSEEADYFEAIGSCISQILDAVREQRLSSVAFPLIGCGLFGLDEKMLIEQLLDEINQHTARSGIGTPIKVWLVVHDSSFERVVGKMFELMLSLRSETHAVEVPLIGIPLLDSFAGRLARRHSEEWAKFEICRYTEIATAFMLFSLCRAHDYPLVPEKLFEPDRPVGFGQVLSLAIQFAATITSPAKSWGAACFSNTLRHKPAQSALAELNAQRNNLAHGRASSSLVTINQLMLEGLQLSQWNAIPVTDGALQLEDWNPWIAELPRRGRDVGILERWQKNLFRYVIPHTGEIFKIVRPSAEISAS